MELVNTMDWLYFRAVDKSTRNEPPLRRASLHRDACASMPASGAPPQRFAAAGVRIAALMACVLFGPPALADDKPRGGVVVEQGTQRYGDLRRTLLRIADMPAGQHDRQRLSADERGALGREWRETLSGGIYERGDRAGQSQRRLRHGPD